jgi:hypothetical protein
MGTTHIMRLKSRWPPLPEQKGSDLSNVTMLMKVHPSIEQPIVAKS